MTQHTFRWTTVLVVVCGLCVVFEPTTASAQGFWTTFHGDARYSGRIEGQGEIVTPAVSWEHPTGGNVRDEGIRLADLDGDGTLDMVTSVGLGLIARRLDGTVLWDTAAQDITRIEAISDFNGDGLVDILGGGRAFAIFDGRTGRLLWRLTHVTGASTRLINSSALPVNLDDDPEEEVVFSLGVPPALFRVDFSRGFGTPEQWVNTDPALPGGIYRVAIGDFDPDTPGLEAATINQDNCQAVFVSLDTGATLRVATRDDDPGLVDGLACLGLIQAADVDDDGVDELVFAAFGGALNTSSSITVYDYADDAIRWQQDFAVGEQVRTDAPGGAVGDLGGDGSVEVVVSVFNGDIPEVESAGRWVTVIYDGATGELRGALPDTQASGLVDIDGDGQVELVTRETVAESSRVLAFGRVQAWTLEDDGPTLLAEASDVQAIPFVDETPRINLRPSNAVPAIFATPDGISGMMVLRRAEGEPPTVRRLSLTENGFETMGELPVAPGVSISFLRTIEGGAQGVFKTDAGELILTDGALREQRRLPYANHITGPPVVAQTAEGVRVIVRNSADNLQAIDTEPANLFAPPEILWTQEGKVDPLLRRAGHLLSLDVDEDGDFEVAHSGESVDGEPFVELLGPDGSVLWRRDLPDALYAPFGVIGGHFGGGDTQDVAVMLLRLDVSPLIVTFDGDSGEILSEYVPLVEEVERFPNVGLMALEDRDGDGLNDLLVVHYTTLEIRSGGDLSRIGEVLDVPPATVRPANSALLDEDTVYLNLFTGDKAAVDISTGEVLWNVQVPSMAGQEIRFGAVTDANGDGVADIAIPGGEGELVVLDGETGNLIRALCLKGGQAIALPALPERGDCGEGSPVTAIAAADIDGDGGDEHIMGTADGWLMAIDAASGEVVWSLFLRFGVQSVIVADLDGDGALEVGAVTVDARLIGVDNAEIPAAQEVRDVFVNELSFIETPSIDIDVLTRTDVFGAAWEEVPGATSYLVTILTENFNAIHDPLQVTETTAVVDNLSMIPGLTYFASVVPFDGAQRAGPATLSDGALVVGTGPQILGFQAIHNIFDPSQGETTTLSATIAAFDGLAQVVLTIRVKDSTASGDLFVAEITPDEHPYQLNVDWAGFVPGTEDADEPDLLPAGIYEARLFAIDERGEATTDFVDIEIRFEPPEEIEPEPTPPAPIIVKKGGCCSTVPHRPEPLALRWLLLGLVVVIVRRLRA